MNAKTAQLTPAMRQYAHFKEKYPDCVLFFRMGDFYETFYEDARLCSRVCGLALTSRSKGPDPVPLAGVPFHAVDGYIKKMISAGYKVAVCEQIEDSKTAKGVVKRDVVRILTAGTLTEEPLLDSARANFLCAVCFSGGGLAALSWVDVSTGRFFVQWAQRDRLIEELVAVSASECLLPDCRGELFEKEARELSRQIAELTGAVITERPGWYFDPYQGRKRLLKHFGTTTLDGFGVSDEDALIAPAGAIIEYLNETQKTTLGHISSITKVARSNFLQIDPGSLRALEVLSPAGEQGRNGSLLDCLDCTLTGMGTRMLREWLCRPLCDGAAIEMRQELVARFRDDAALLADIRGLLANMADLERIAARLATVRATPRDLLALAETLRIIPRLKQLLAGLDEELARRLTCRCDPIDDLAVLIDKTIEPGCPNTIRDGGVIRNGFDRRLDELRSIMGGGREWLAEYQAGQAGLTGITNLKVGYNKVFGYYIEVNHSQSVKVPASYVRKQTIKNAERYITDELKDYEAKVLGAREKALAVEQELFEDIRRRAAAHVARLQSSADAIARCDCIAALANVAKQRDYIRPRITDDGRLLIRDGRHPVLSESIGAELTPNDIEIGGNGGDFLILTGPNMSGKSTYIRQTALLVIMAQAGSFIPASEAVIGLVDRIFTRIGAADEILRGRSTFMVEMTEAANIINNATKRSLVILDEVGRGTSTYDGLALAWAITEHIATKIKCRTLFATHYHELTELADLFGNVVNCNVAVREWMDEIVFLHKIIPGGTDKSYGIHVAKLAGVPRSVIDRSREILAELESTFAKEASGQKFSCHRTRKPDIESLFVARNKTVLDRLSSVDVNALTPLEAINLLNEIKQQITPETIKETTWQR